MAKKRPPQTKRLEFPVKFGGVTFGDETARVGVEVERKHLTLSVADSTFCNRRLQATIHAEAGNNNPDQSPIFPAGVDLEAAWDSHSFSVTKKKISFGLTCNLESIDREHLTHFPKRAGSLVIEVVEDLPDKSARAEAGSDEDDSEDE